MGPRTLEQYQSYIPETSQSNNMPTVKQNIGVLRNGVQRRRAQAADNEDEANIRLPVRDHYERFEQYMKRQYPKRKQDRFADDALMRQAEVADRNTSLGIIDTVVREFIIFWMPEVELFLADNAYDDEDIERQAYQRLAGGLEKHIMAVSDQVDCGRDGAAAALRDALQERTMQYLADLYNSCEDVLKDHEKPDFDPKQRSSRRSKTALSDRPTATTELLTEARTLDSSLAWSLAGDRDEEPLQRSASPRIRHLSPIRQLDYGEAADNGQIWGNPDAGTGKRKFEIEITNTIKISGSEDIETIGRKRFRDQAMAKDNMVDLTAEDDSEAMPPGGMSSNDWQEGGSGDGFVDASEFPIPGAFN
ncbi:hypothetical protein OHC33_008522 [Knufia fluminis]|uniref:Uncharacterized protein n=1 Tax=Knufia fluminis TaxID=191047 RepID=A0AAN8EAG5_9EURO|nr:hypothetical protein OHC33_008522 [Knufia fluminis]